MKIPLPAYSLTFVLPEDSSDCGSLTSSETQELRKLTGGYLIWKLKPAYPTLTGLDLKFSAIQDNEPQISVKVQAAIFADSNTFDNHEVFEKMVASLDKRFLGYVQQEMAKSHGDSSLLKAVKVETLALEEDQEEEENLQISQRRSSQMVPVRASNVFVAFTMPLCEKEPTKSDYQALTDATQRFYSGTIRDQLENFQDVKVTMRKALYKQSIPNDDYDVYIEWDIVATFTPFLDTMTVPGKHWLYYLLVKQEMNRYFWKFVRTLEGTPFTMATSLLIEQVEEEDQKQSMERMRQHCGE